MRVAEIRLLRPCGPRRARAVHRGVRPAAGRPDAWGPPGGLGGRAGRTRGAAAGRGPVVPALDSDRASDHRPERLPQVLEEPRLLPQERPSDLRREVDVPLVADQSEDGWVVEDVENLLDLGVRQTGERVMDREVLPEFLADAARPRLVVSVEDPGAEVPPLEGLDRGLRAERRAQEAREDSPAARRLRLARRVPDNHHVVGVTPLWEAERNAPRDVQDGLRPLQERPHGGAVEHLLEGRVRGPRADAQSDPGPVPAPDDPPQEPGAVVRADEELHEAGVALHPDHLDL